MLRHLWKCPLCEGAKLAPSRPRRDDTRRYCLPCSERTGRLVQRTCPTIDKRRAEKAERRAAKGKRAAQRAVEQRAERAKTWPYLLEEQARAWYKLAAWGGVDLAGKVGVVIRQRQVHSGSSGHAWSSGRTLVTAGSWRPGAYYVLLHELCHQACYQVDRNFAHDEMFWSRLCRAVEEVTGKPTEFVRGRAAGTKLAGAFEGFDERKEQR